MHRSSLLEILRTFSKQELAKFEDFVKSPYFNKKENVVKLLLDLKSHAPGFESDDLAKEKIWSRIFPDAAYNYGVMKNLIHDLGKLCESFLSEEVYKTDEMQRSLDLLSSFFHRDIPNIFQTKADSAERWLVKKYESNDYVYMSRMYEAFRKVYELKANYNHHSAYRSKNNDDLRNASENLVYGFLADCFRVFHKLMVHNLDMNHSPLNDPVYFLLSELDRNSIITHLLDRSEAQNGRGHDILKCYYAMYKAMLSNETSLHYSEFKNALIKYGSSLSDGERRALYTCLLNCLTNLKITTKDFYKEYFSLIQLGFQSKAMLNENGTITFQSFFSVVNVSCGAKELEFAEEFISEYTDKLPEELRKCAYLYSMAQLNFTKGDFSKSLEYLAQIQSHPGFLKYSIKNLQFSIYFELDDRESFEYSFDSFKHFIRRNRLTSESRAITLEKYCSYINALFKLRESFDAHDASVLREEITANKVINKLWLIEKIDQLENAGI